MSKPSSFPTTRLLATFFLTLPLHALAGVATIDGADLAKTVAADKPGRSAGGYQVRCWQMGRLLFEENQVTLPSEQSRFGLKLSGNDRNGKPIYIAETANATCLIRSSEDERSWPRETR